MDIENYHYDVSFLSFERNSNIPEITWKVMQLLLKAFEEKSILFKGDQTIKLAEIGCGPGERTIGYFRGLHFKSGFDIRATDINTTFTGQNDYQFAACNNDGSTAATKELNEITNNAGLAVKAFLQAISSQTMPIKSFSIKRGNSFKDNLLNLLAWNSDHAEAERKTFSMAFICHCLYYVFDESVPEDSFQQIFRSLANDILSDNGIAIFCHSIPKPDSCMALQWKFKNQYITNTNPTTEEYEKNALDCIIKRCCQNYNLPCYKVEFPTKIYFSQAFLNQQDIARDISRYDELSQDTIDNIQRLLLIPRRSLKELYMDQSDIGLNSLFDTVLPIIKQHGGIPEYDALQIVLSQHASPQLRKDVESIVEQLNSDVLSTFG
ncbi:uncharacterized protein TRIADDRAFT_56143 [Trichoplax adhaerens]|uniref:Methyltransferase domain-containing protein n=1 Tax=Trichoplax adhaerens TaxID=10228 RepID=B3RXA8_TRIAD|nr:predicted protein [Trichoplax adhaerens]EDV24837.1 predicted protein [Trichoplax adhaerens]|eukprot:XP_002112727.1 predicted protein [Trichoplax adhaerens]